MPIEELFNTTPRCQKSKLNVLPAHSDTSNSEALNLGRFPKWLHRKLPAGSHLQHTGAIIEHKRLHTVCEEAKCPNLLECYSKKTATFLILGKQCTRHCGFCEIDFSKTPQAPDPQEPLRIAESVKELGLRHVVITMVARDDLPDGGARHLVDVIAEIRKYNEDVTIETLTSDFDGNLAALKTLLDAAPEIFNHNMETVASLSPKVRHRATYERSLHILEQAKRYKPDTLIKTGIMVGLGETKEEVISTLQDIARTGCDIVTIGQYLQASHKKIAVKEFVHPDTFAEYEKLGTQIGIKHVYSGPFVRSSYNAGLVLSDFRGKQKLINSH